MLLRILYNHFNCLIRLFTVWKFRNITLEGWNKSFWQRVAQPADFLHQIYCTNKKNASLIPALLLLFIIELSLLFLGSRYTLSPRPITLFSPPFRWQTHKIIAKYLDCITPTFLQFSKLHFSLKKKAKKQTPHNNSCWRAAEGSAATRHLGVGCHQKERVE